MPHVTTLVALALAGAFACRGAARGAAPQEWKPAADRHGDPLPAGAVARLGTVRFRHGQWVRCVAFSPDGKTIASGGEDHTIRLWDRATGKEIRRLTGHRSGVYHLAFTPDGKHLVSATGDFGYLEDASVRLWDVTAGKEVRRFAVGNLGTGARVSLGAAALSPDGKSLAAGYCDRLYLLDVASGRQRAACRVPKASASLLDARFSPDGKRVAAFFMCVGVCLIDAKSGRLLWTNADQSPNSGPVDTAWSPDGKTLAVAWCGQRPLCLLDAATGKEVRRSQGEPHASKPLHFSPDGKRMFSANWADQTVTVWDTTTVAPVGKIGPAACGLHDTALSPDGKTLAAAAGGAVQFWDVTTGGSLPAPDGARGHVGTVALSPDGRGLLACSPYETAGVRFWNLSSGRQAASLAGRECYQAAALAPDGKTFAASTFRAGPVLADAVTGKVVRRCEAKGRFGPCALAFSPDGKLLAGTECCDRTIRIHLWDPATGKEVAAGDPIPQPEDWPAALSYSPDGKYLALGGSDGVIHLWDVAARKEVRRITSQRGLVSALAIAPDGRTVAAVTAEHLLGIPQPTGRGDRVIRLWDVATGEVRHKIDGPPGGSRCVAWSPDGRTLATGGDDCRVRLWEVASEKQRAVIAGHEGPVTSLAFTSDGRRLISGSADTTALVWDLTRPPRAVPRGPGGR